MKDEMEITKEEFEAMDKKVMEAIALFDFLCEEANKQVVEKYGGTHPAKQIEKILEEVQELANAFDEPAMDKHLHHLRNYQVELADIVICAMVLAKDCIRDGFLAIIIDKIKFNESRDQTIN